MESRKRSWAKSVTWRVIGIFLLGAITYLVTGNWKEMTVITLLFHGIRVVLYYYHERLWQRISWGRFNHPLAELPVKKELPVEDLETVREKLRSLGHLE